jgi:hypothetical protein
LRWGSGQDENLEAVRRNLFFHRRDEGEAQPIGLSTK